MTYIMNEFFCIHIYWLKFASMMMQMPRKDSTICYDKNIFCSVMSYAQVLKDFVDFVDFVKS
jgi:hypothetical protein